MFKHRIERCGDIVRVTLDVELSDLVGALQQDTGLSRQLTAYCENHLVPDVFEVAAILLNEDSSLGTVKWFREDLGYGFITRYDGEDVFVHYSAIAAPGYRSLEQGQRVRFKCREGQQRLCAVDVTLLDPAL